MKFQTSLIWLIILAGLTACSVPTVKDGKLESINWSQQQKRLSQLHHWTISGRISIQTEYTGGQVDYHWQQHNQTDYDIRLQLPMGAGTTFIRGRADGVNIKNTSGDELFDTDVDKLIQRINGWPVPVSGLFYWVRALPAPNHDYEITQWNEQGMPKVILQDGWRIELQKYKTIEGKVLPGKIFINRTEGEEVDVRLIIRQWNLHAVLNV